MIVDTIVFSFVGDIMITNNYPFSEKLPSYEVFKNSDIAFGNLEGPIIENGKSTKCSEESIKLKKCFAFKMPKISAIYLKEMGFNVLALANNHILDYGIEGIESTKKMLDSVKINYCGTNKEDNAYVILKVRNTKIGIICFDHNPISPSVNDIEYSKKIVRDLRKNVDILIVSFHGGAEGSNAQRVKDGNEYFYGENRGNLKLFSRIVIDEGADLVIGHGPHVLRGMEVYKNKLIAYSLGNFLTYEHFNLSGNQSITCVLQVKLTSKGEFVEGKIYPFKLFGIGLLREDNDKNAIKIIKKLSELDFPETKPIILDDGTIKLK